MALVAEALLSVESGRVRTGDGGGDEDSDGPDENELEDEDVERGDRERDEGALLLLLCAPDNPVGADEEPTAGERSAGGREEGGEGGDMESAEADWESFESVMGDVVCDFFEDSMANEIS